MCSFIHLLIPQQIYSLSVWFRSSLRIVNKTDTLSEKAKRDAEEVPPVSRPCPVPVPAGGWITVLHSSSWLLHSLPEVGLGLDMWHTSGQWHARNFTRGLLWKLFPSLTHERSHFCTCLLHSHLRWCLRKTWYLKRWGRHAANHEESHGQKL